MLADGVHLTRLLVAWTAAGALAGCGVIQTPPNDNPPLDQDGGGHPPYPDARTPDGPMPPPPPPHDGGSDPEMRVTSNAVDFDGDRFSDLFLYRPGRGAAWIARSNGEGDFSPAYAVGDDGSAGQNGIAGYDLLSEADRVLALDYNGDHREDLFLFRAGRGAAWVARSDGAGAFTAVYAVGDDGPAGRNGIAGYDLLSEADRVVVLDYDGDGDDDLFLFRPGRGAAWIARSNGDGTFTAVYAVGDDGSAGQNGIAGYDLLSEDDRVSVLDFDGNGREDLFLYRPGRGAAWVARSNGDGTFTAVYAVGDDGPAGSNGVAGYDLLSPADRIAIPASRQCIGLALRDDCL